jgi:hypothetical protein
MGVAWREGEGVRDGNGGVMACVDGRASALVLRVGLRGRWASGACLVQREWIYSLGVG